MLNIQYASDLHIEEWRNGTNFLHFITPQAPILILPGDICSVFDPLYEKFLSWASNNWYLVIFTSGNHEYHSKVGIRTISEAETIIHNIVRRYNNLKYLNNGNSYMIPGTRIRFVGSTLWSNVNPDIYPLIYKKKKDFLYIYNNDGTSLHPSQMSDEHIRQTKLLEKAIIPRYRDETLIVLTHYLPSYNLIENCYQTDTLKSCYASNDDYLLKPNIAAWICGHGHRSTIYKAKNGTTVYMNARGYNRADEIERKEDPYNPRSIIRICKK
jgi:UDP-2,3-diacylglucosamine pyrophosphatase LpxH